MSNNLFDLGGPSYDPFKLARAGIEIDVAKFESAIGDNFEGIWPNI